MVFDLHKKMTAQDSGYHLQRKKSVQSKVNKNIHLRTNAMKYKEIPQKGGGMNNEV